MRDYISGKLTKLIYQDYKPFYSQTTLSIYLIKF